MLYDIIQNGFFLNYWQRIIIEKMLNHIIFNKKS